MLECCHAAYAGQVSEACVRYVPPTDAPVTVAPSTAAAPSMAPPRGGPSAAVAGTAATAAVDDGKSGALAHDAEQHPAMRPVPQEVAAAEAEGSPHAAHQPGEAPGGRAGIAPSHLCRAPRHARGASRP
jgi:hypothetical protein